MKIAIISDIHGNAVALEAVLEDIKRAAPDQVVCLGDVVVMGPQPGAALAVVRELGCPVVVGNTDEWVLNPTPFTIRSERDQILYDIELWGAQQLTADDKAFIHKFLPTVSVDLGNGRSLLCSHGSPRRHTDVITAATNEDELAQMLDGNKAAIFAGGHTHTPLLRRFGESFILNPGSVGLPLIKQPDGNLTNPTRAEYAMVESTNGRLNISLRHVSYPLAALQDAVRRSTMPHRQAYLDDWVESP